MKKSSLKVLISLGALSLHSAYLDEESLAIIVPELSISGQRSLLYHLKRSFLVEQFRPAKGVKSLRITTGGMRVLKAEFPALFPESGKRAGWHCMVFVKPPKNDPAFRYLRSQVLADGGISLTRGVYFKQSSFSATLMVLCDKLYAQAVTVFTVNSWIFGFDSLYLDKIQGADTQFSMLSGISNEITQLLNKINKDNTAQNQQKKLIEGLLQRYFSITLNYPYFSSNEFSQDISAGSVFLQVGEVLKLLGRNG